MNSISSVEKSLSIAAASIKVVSNASRALANSSRVTLGNCVLVFAESTTSRRLNIRISDPRITMASSPVMAA